MTYKIKKMINNGTEYKIGSIDSSNDTYENIIHLSQAEYDALETKDPDTLYSTPDNVESGEFVPENEGETGQVLKKTETGYDWDTVNEVPDGGTTGQVLIKSLGGYNWGNMPISLEYLGHRTGTITTTQNIYTCTTNVIIFCYSSGGSCRFYWGPNKFTNPYNQVMLNANDSSGGTIIYGKNGDALYAEGAWQSSSANYELYIFKITFNI